MSRRRRLGLGSVGVLWDWAALVCWVFDRDAGSCVLVHACAGLCDGEDRQVLEGRSAARRAALMQHTTLSTQVCRLTHSHNVLRLTTSPLQSYNFDNFCNSALAVSIGKASGL